MGDTRLARLQEVAQTQPLRAIVGWTVVYGTYATVVSTEYAVMYTVGRRRVLFDVLGQDVVGSIMVAIVTTTLIAPLFVGADYIVGGPCRRLIKRLLGRELDA